MPTIQEILSFKSKQNGVATPKRSSSPLVSEPTGGGALCSEWLDVTPAMASAWIALNATNQRRVSTERVEMYARDMIAGRWHVNHQGIAFDEHGALVDGQHRLLAIIKAGVTIRLLVTFGTSIDGIDRGRGRSAIDARRIRGSGRCDARYIAVVKTMQQIFTDNWTRPLSDSDVDQVEARHTEGLAWADNYLSDLYTAPVFAALTIGWEVYPDKTDEFAKQITSRIGLLPNSPAINFIRGFEGMKKRLGAAERRGQALLTLHGIRQHTEGVSGQFLRPDPKTVVEWWRARWTERP